MMAATLAFGGKNPVTGKQVFDAANVPRTESSYSPTVASTARSSSSSAHAPERARSLPHCAVRRHATHLLT